jgi:hypothetical protein
MQRLADQISGQLGKPVTDATGLKGRYDIGLYWVADSTAETDAGPTLLQALQDQLGLRLESKKGPVDFIVVDHAEKTPAERLAGERCSTRLGFDDGTAAAAVCALSPIVIAGEDRPVEPRALAKRYAGHHTRETAACAIFGLEAHRVLSSMPCRVR